MPVVAAAFFAFDAEKNGVSKLIHSTAIPSCFRTNAESILSNPPEESPRALILQLVLLVDFILFVYSTLHFCPKIVIGAAPIIVWPSIYCCHTIKDDDFITSLQFALLVTFDPAPGTIPGATGKAKLARASL
jgi:hypothetical protein